MKNVIELNSNLVNIFLTILRDKKTKSQDFKNNLKIISNILAVKMLDNIDQKEFLLNTPLEKTIGYKFRNEIILLPILRAGEGMLSAFRELIINPKIGFIGLARNEKTLKPKLYLKKIPKVNKNDLVIILDPMLATGGSINFTISYLKKNNCKNIIVASILSSPEGIKNITKNHPDIKIYTSKIDRELNSLGYILPGLGDAGDRLFDT